MSTWNWMFVFVLCTAGGGRVRLLRRQGGRAVVPGELGHLRAAQERRRLVGGRPGRHHRTLSGQLRRELLLSEPLRPLRNPESFGNKNKKKRKTKSLVDQVYEPNLRLMFEGIPSGWTSAHCCSGPTNQSVDFSFSFVHFLFLHFPPFLPYPTTTPNSVTTDRLIHRPLGPQVSRQTQSGRQTNHSRKTLRSEPVVGNQ